MDLFGAHVSSAGTILKTFERARELGAETFQFFLRSPRSWKWKRPDDRTAEAFSEELKNFAGPVVVHAPYLLNPATKDRELRQRTLSVMVEELEFCDELGIHYYNFHPGTARGISEDRALDNVVSLLLELLERKGGSKTRILIENTAGQRGDIGKNLHELERITRALDGAVDLCLDTCHLFASGYDISGEKGFERFVRELEERDLLGRVRVVHANDSKAPLGGRRDRHEHIGEGFIGIKGFRNMLSHPLLGELPYIIETPKTGDMDRVNLGILRKIKLSGDL